jgi:hypothetical protein
MRTLQPGADTAPDAVREALLALDAGMPGGTTSVDVAWFACDGRRTIGEIAGLLRDEGSAAGDDIVAAFFELTAALGASEWRNGAS